MSETVRYPDDRARALIVLLTGCTWAMTAPDADAEQTFDDFDDYWFRFGLRHFRPEEAVRAPPDKLEEVAALGYSGGWLISPPSVWPFVLCRYLVYDKVRAAADVPISVRWDWRPPRVNFQVAKSRAKQSDHLYARAADLYFKGTSKVQSRKAKARAEEIVLRPLWESKLAQLSIGFGDTMLHVGMFSGRQRSWSYGDRKKPEWAK